MSEIRAGALGQVSRAGIGSVPVRGDSPVSWADVVENWQQYLAGKSDKHLVFVGDTPENRGEFMAAPYSHRFTQEYTKRQYAQIMDFARGVNTEYEDPHLAFLTFSASTTDQMGNYRPPLDHLDNLLDSWDRGIRYELNHVMEADRKKDRCPTRSDWEYLQVREPTTNEGRVPGGYAHIHVIVAVDGEVSRGRFESVIDKHTEKCEWAEPEAHPYEECIEVMDAEELVNLGAYVFQYLGKSYNPEEMTDYERRFSALMYESGRRRFQPSVGSPDDPSSGAVRWMKNDEPESESGRWMFGGIGSTEKVEEMMEQYEDADDLRVQEEVGVREYLSGYSPREAVYSDETDDRNQECVKKGHKFWKGECVRCGVPYKEWMKGKVGEPPPGG